MRVSTNSGGVSSNYNNSILNTSVPNFSHKTTIKGRESLKIKGISKIEWVKAKSQMFTTKDEFLQNSTSRQPSVKLKSQCFQTSIA